MLLLSELVYHYQGKLLQQEVILKENLLKDV